MSSEKYRLVAVSRKKCFRSIQVIGADAHIAPESQRQRSPAMASSEETEFIADDRSRDAGDNDTPNREMSRSGVYRRRYEHGLSRKRDPARFDPDEHGYQRVTPAAEHAGKRARGQGEQARNRKMVHASVPSSN